MRKFYENLEKQKLIGLFVEDADSSQQASEECHGEGDHSHENDAIDQEQDKALHYDELLQDK